MKKKLIALTLAAVTAGASNATIFYQQDGTKISLYGSVRVLFTKLEDSRTDLINDGSRFWLNFSQEMGGGATAFAAMQLRPQTQYDDNFSDGFSTHRIYSGLRFANIGEISFGNQSTIANRLKTSDFTEKFGGITRAGVAYSNEGTYRTYGRTQYGLNTSGRKVIHVQTAEWNGLTFGADYIFARNGSERKKEFKGKVRDNYKNDQWQAGVLYYKRLDDLRLKANAVYGYQRVNPTLNSRSYGLGLGLGYHAFNFGIDLLRDKNTCSDKYKNSCGGDDTSHQTAWQVGAKYYITYPWDVYFAYRQTKYHDSVKNKGFSLGSHYQITRRVKAFVEYATNKASNVYKYSYGYNKGKWAYPTERQNGYYAGLRVDF